MPENAKRDDTEGTTPDTDRAGQRISRKRRRYGWVSSRNVGVNQESRSSTQ